MAGGGVDLPAVIGHRGARAHAPENTLAGFRTAARLGARWVELDARLTADGGLAVIHDARLERTTDGRGLVKDTPMAALAALDAGSWFDPAYGGEPVPLLEAALREIAGLGMGANVELKTDPPLARRTAEAAARAIAAAWPPGRPAPLVSSFDHGCLVALREVAPHLPRGMLTLRLRRGWTERAAALEAATIHTDHTPLDRAAVAAAKALGRPLAVYTVNDPDRARALRRWGVDAVFSDTPGVILRALDGMPG